MQGGKISIFATFSGHLGFSRKMEKCQYLEHRKRWSDFERIFDPQGGTRVSCGKGENFNFRHFWRPFWIFAGNEKVSISQTVRDRAISSKFLTGRVVQESPFQWGEISIFAAILDFCRK